MRGNLRIELDETSDTVSMTIESHEAHNNVAVTLTAAWGSLNDQYDRLRNLYIAAVRLTAPPHPCDQGQPLQDLVGDMAGYVPNPNCKRAEDAR